MLRLGGENADGVRLHPFSTRRYLEEVSIAHIGEGLRKSGRHRRDVEGIAGGYGFIGTGPNQEAIAKRYGGCADSVLLQISADDGVDRLAECVAAIQWIPAPIDG